MSGRGKVGNILFSNNLSFCWKFTDCHKISLNCTIDCEIGTLKINEMFVHAENNLFDYGSLFYTKRERRTDTFCIFLYGLKKEHIKEFDIILFVVIK